MNKLKHFSLLIHMYFFRHLERVVSDVVRRSGLRDYALGSATSDLISGDCTASSICECITLEKAGPAADEG